MNWKQQRETLIDAMVQAEGGQDAFVRAVRCSIPTCKDYDEARVIAHNTLVHALWDYTMNEPAPFIAFLGSRWAPIGASNDPTGLNKHWVPNVQTIYAQLVA